MTDLAAVSCTLERLLPVNEAWCNSVRLSSYGRLKPFKVAGFPSRYSRLPSVSSSAQVRTTQPIKADGLTVVTMPM